MKKFLYIFAAATVMLQACSTGKSFSKKRYGHLKWIDHNTQVEVPGKDVQATDQAQPVKNERKQEVVQQTIDKPVTEISPVQTEKHTPAVQDFGPAAPSLPAQKNQQQVGSEQEIANEPVKDVNAGSETIVKQKQRPQTISSPKPMMDDDVKLIICVILALFIPPLAMYLWDRQTDIWFVVDLILFLAILFLFFGYGFGLVGLLAVVIALLRIFELL